MISRLFSVHKRALKTFCCNIDGVQLFSIDRLTDELFRRLMRKHYPGPDDDIDLWLSTNEYPERFRIGTL